METEELLESLRDVVVVVSQACWGMGLTARSVLWTGSSVVCVWWEGRRNSVSKGGGREGREREGEKRKEGECSNLH